MKRAWKAVLAGLFVAAIAMPASAESVTQGFEGFTSGSPLVGAEGWTYSGGSSYDVGINEDGAGNQAVRISNGTMSGSFGDWLFSPAIQPSTETTNQQFVAEFDLSSMKPNQVQDNLQISVAPQTAGGARMSFLKFEDTTNGIEVSFADVLNLSETLGQDDSSTPLVNEFPQEAWRLVKIATLDRSLPHHVKLVMNLIGGPHNDVVQVYIDGSAGLVPGRTGAATFDGYYAPVDWPNIVNKAKAGQTIPMKWRLTAPSFATSWEDYYRYDRESNAGQGAGPYTTRNVDSLIFQARCSAVGPCANAGVQGQGFLIDNVSYTSSSIGTPLPVASQGVSDASVYANPPFTIQGESCGGLGDEIDPIEVYATNTGGLMYHGNGVWQFNLKTLKSWAGNCAQVQLDGFDESTAAQFQFVK